MYNSFTDDILSSIGYYKDQRGIIYRYLREAQNWHSHLENTKNAILDGIPNKKRNKAIVLGSGWLLDVPLSELAQTYNEVWLVDIYHPVEAVKKASQFKNIRFVQIEITGLAEQIYKIRKDYKATKIKMPLESLKPTPMINLNAFDYVISCNILSQLDIILTDYLREKDIYSEEELVYLVKLIQSSHINSLPPRKSTLICDIEELRINPKDDTIEKTPLILVPLIRVKTINSWVWKFDTQMTYYESFYTDFNVAAFSL